MKLTKGKLVETIRRKNEGWTTYQARKIARVTVRRVNQVLRAYERTGTVPVLGKRVGRPSPPLQDWEVKAVREAYLKYRVSASTLEHCIDRDVGRHVPHNRVHRILVELGYAKPKAHRDVRKKDWIRYERRHSLTAVHMDWMYDTHREQWVLPVVDDASRKLLSLIETTQATTDASIQAIEQALTHGIIRQCITDHGTQFTKEEGKTSRFATFLEEHGIRQILCRIKHPQSNGKSEKFNDTYQHHRHAFPTREAFIHWYNNVRPHRSLRFDVLETPEQAFQRKMRKE